MRKKLKLLLVAATLALTIGIISLGGGVVSAPAKAAGSGTLAGFTSSGASVYIATDGTDAKQMRFQIDLTADKAAYAGEGKTAGVVYIPLDVYKVNGITELTKDTPDAITADVTKNWAANADGSYSSYAYLDPRFIPAGQENRTLVARGYIVDGENVYYTDEVKASMAYVAWKNLDMEEGKYADQLKKYMGPYTLTYGDDGKIENLYYGDTFTLPTSIGTDTVDKWYWDLACTQEIKPTDYATGSMKIYYELRKVAVSGTIACADSSVDLTKTEIYANGKKLAATINASGNYTVNVSIKNAYDLVFKNGNYLAYGNVTVGDDAVTDVNATLKPNTFDIGNYKNTRVSGATFDKNAALDGSVSVNHSSHFMLPMPNTATTEDREYTIDLSQIGDAPSVDFYYGFGLSNGDKVLSFSFSHLNWLRVNISQVGGTGVERVYLFMQKAGWQPKQGKILRTKDEIKLYVDNTYVLSVTKDGITTELGGGWGGINADEFAGFLGENKELALVLNSTGTPMSFTRTYSFSMANIGTVIGTVAAPSGSTDFDLTKVKVYADGNLTEATVAADGTFSLVIPEGTHNFSFETEGYIAYADGVTVGKDAAPITATLVDNTNATGNYGSIKSSTDGYDRSDALDGIIAVSGHNKLLIMPNIAADKTYFVYEVQVSSGVSRTTDDATYGIALTDGKKVLSIGFQRWGRITVNMASGSGAENVATYFKDMGCIGGDTLKFVVSGSKIEFYYNNTLFLTFTADGIANGDGVSNISGQFGTPADSLSHVYAEQIAGFFADNAKLACGLSNGLNNGSTTATYTYSIADMYSVTGKVSAPSGSTDFDLTKVKVYANGNLTDTVVAANGTFSLILPEGSHDFSFETEGYIAYADGITVGKNTAPINVTLLDGTYAIGNYGNVKSSTNVTYDKTAALTGTVTVSGNASSYVLAVPNLATSEPVQFNIKVSDKAYTGVEGQMNEQYYGFGITNGTDTLRFVIGRWQALGVNVGNISKTYGVSPDLLDGFGMHPKDCKIVCTSEKIELYIAGNFILGWTADGITAGWADVESNAELNAAIASKFLGGDKKLTITLDYFINAAVTNHAATYTYSANKLYTVSGTLATAAGVDLTATTLTIDGAATPITVGSDGKYTLLVPEGERKFVFSNGNLGATVVKTVINGENVVDVTSWTDYTWAVGNYGSVNSTQTPDLNQSGVYTVSGQNQMLIMPNTATSEAFTYEVTVSDITRSNNDSKIGICITDGKYRLGIGLSKNWQVLVSLSQDNGEASHNFYGLGDAQGVDGVKLKFVVTKQDIQFYVNDSLRFTFTSEGITSTINALTDSWVNDTLTGAYTNGIAGFFADNAKIAVGIVNGWHSTVTATYTCSITKN